MAEQFQNRVDVLNGDSRLTIALDADGPAVYVGGSGHDGTVVVLPAAATRTDDAAIVLNAARADVVVGAVDLAGHVYVRDAAGRNVVHVSGTHANLAMGGHQHDGDVVLMNGDGDETVHLNGGNGAVLARTGSFGGDSEDGELRVRNAAGQTAIRLNGATANLTLGGNNQDGDIFVRNREGVDTIHIDGQSGDIILENADCAEDFEVDGSDSLEPGMLVVIADRSRLRRSTQAYDTRVAGILAGANRNRPAIILGRRRAGSRRLPVAMMGTVYCMADAQFGRIDVGDLLTTSDTPGHAMKATDPLRAFGAIVGKALEPLREGRGVIPVLVALQ